MESNTLKIAQQIKMIELAMHISSSNDLNCINKLLLTRAEVAKNILIYKYKDEDTFKIGIEYFEALNDEIKKALGV